MFCVDQLGAFIIAHRRIASTLDILQAVVDVCSFHAAGFSNRFGTSATHAVKYVTHLAAVLPSEPPRQ